MTQRTRQHEVAIALQSDKLPGDYAALALQVEQAGFDVLSIYGDLWYQPPLVPLVIAAQATQRLRLGPASLNPYTLHPVEIAGQIAMLDWVSNGRAYLGLSRGAWLEDIGVRQTRPLAHLQDTVAVVQRLLSGERVEVAGETAQLSAEHQLRYPRRRPQVPILIGSWGRRTLTWAGGFADEVKIGGSTNPDLVATVRTWLNSGAQAGERSASATRIVLGAVTVIDDDRDLARRRVRRDMALYLPVVAPLDPTVALDPELLARIDRLVQTGNPDAAGALIPDVILERFAFAGDAADIVRQAMALFDAGVERVEFGTPHGFTAERGIHLLGEQVLPVLRAATR